MKETKYEECKEAEKYINNKEKNQSVEIDSKKAQNYQKRTRNHTWQMESVPHTFKTVVYEDDTERNKRDKDTPNEILELKL